MEFIKDIAKYILREEQQPATPQTQEASTPRKGGSYDNVYFGHNPMTIAAVYRCINFLSDSVANLRLQYLRLRDGIFIEDSQSRLNELLSIQPNESVNAFDMWKQAIQYMLIDGNAYILPIYNVASMDVDTLILLSRGTVTIDQTNRLYIVNDTFNGISGTYREDEIIRIKNYCPDGITGMGVIAYARQYLNIAHAAQDETLRRIRTGGIVKGIVGNDSSVRGFGEYQDKELSKTAIDINERLNEIGQNIVSVPGSVTFKPVSLSAADMQFLETVKFNVRDICRMFGVHPSFVFDDTSNNYKSAEMANAAFLSNTLNPLLRRIEIELLRKLVAPGLWGKRRFMFDRRGVFAADLNSMAKYQTQTIAAGVYTVNEWRSFENRPAVPHGDRALVSANLKPLDEL